MNTHKKYTRIFFLPQQSITHHSLTLRLYNNNNNKILVTLLIDWCHFRSFHTCNHQSDTFQNNIPPPPPPPSSSLSVMPHHLSEDAIHLYTNQMTNHSTHVTFIVHSLTRLRLVVDTHLYTTSTPARPIRYFVCACVFSVRVPQSSIQILFIMVILF